MSSDRVFTVEVLRRAVERCKQTSSVAVPLTGKDGQEYFLMPCHPDNVELAEELGIELYYWDKEKGYWVTRCSTAGPEAEEPRSTASRQDGPSDHQASHDDPGSSDSPR